MNISEETFVSWSQGPGKTEAEKCENAVTAVRKAIAADDALSKLDILVFPQGSYYARTNVRQDSDVDICVCYKGALYTEYPEGKTDADFGITRNGLPFQTFKGMVEKALKNYFGSSFVVRGDKAFDIHANTYRIDADVVPTYENRRYSGNRNADSSHHYWTGVAFDTDKGKHIKNWPKQTYENGIARNDATNRRYKRTIRIFKRLRNKMQEDKVIAANNVPSFLIECLLWNAPIAAFELEKYSDVVRRLIIELWNPTKKDETCSKWVEVNHMKWLFNSTQPWTRQQANDFLHAAWNYIGYK